MANKTYRVTRVIIVDRPELRDESFTPVAPGTRTVYPRDHATQARAVAEFNRVVGGEEDFASEYVAKVYVWEMREGRSPRVVRKPVERTRAQIESRKLEMMRNLARRCVQRGALWFRIPSMRTV